MAETKKPVRIWVDGCFDMMHFGHANVLRQARELGDYLVVGVHSDVEVMKNKGIPVMNEEERYAAVAACKWVDEIVKDAPYVTQIEYLDMYNCDFCVHGDDLTTTADGSDCYALVKAAGRFREVKRTQGVSTTDLVGRMLLMSSNRSTTSLSDLDEQTEQAISFAKQANVTDSTVMTSFLPSTTRLALFSNTRQAKPTDKVVYVDGGFDLFSIGHIELLKKASQMGDYVLVGLHDDPTLSKIRGPHLPIMNLHERLLSVLSCRYVDEVIIGAPYSVTEETLNKVQKVSVVVHGKTELKPDINGKDPYEVPKRLGIFVEVETPYSDMTTETIITRILAQRFQYEERNRKKKAKEASAEAPLSISPN